MEEWFSSFDGPIDYDIQNLQIIADNEVAFSYGLNHVDTTKADGGKLEMWWRETICYRKEDGRWIIVHQHSSVPLDVKTCNASLSLKP
jgi:ketosteroid isomerase-like protein